MLEAEELLSVYMTEFLIVERCYFVSYLEINAAFCFLKVRAMLLAPLGFRA